MNHPTGSSISCSTIAGARAPARRRGQRAAQRPERDRAADGERGHAAAPTARSVVVAVRSAQTSQPASSPSGDRLGPQQPHRPAQRAGNRGGVDRSRAPRYPRLPSRYSAAHAGRPGGQSEGHHHQRTQPGRAGPGAAQRSRPDACATPGAGGTPPAWPGRPPQEGVDLVVTLGGDGTVNEVVNGLMTADPADVRPGGAAGRAAARAGHRAGRLDQRLRPRAGPAPGLGRTAPA